MNAIILCMLLLFQLLTFFSFGLLFYKIFKFENSSITLILFSGFIFYFCIFGIIAIPLILLLQPLSFLTTITIIFTCLGIILALICCRKNWMQLLKNLPCACKSHSFMIIFLFAAVFLQQLVIFTHIDGSADGSYYIGKVATDVYTNTMGQYDPYTGTALSILDSRRVFACFQEYNAVLSQFFHIHPLKQAKVIMPAILSLLTSILYYQIGLQLFNRSKKKADFFVFLIFFLDFYSNTIYTNSTFLLTRTYEGKSILANIVIPGMFLCFLLLWKKRTGIYAKILLFSISLSSCFLSSSSMLIVPVGLTAGMIPLCFKEKDVRGLVHYLLCVTPNLIVCILYLLASKGMLVYPIN